MLFRSVWLDRGGWGPRWFGPRGFRPRGFRPHGFGHAPVKEVKAGRLLRQDQEALGLVIRGDGLRRGHRP